MLRHRLAAVAALAIVSVECASGLPAGQGAPVASQVPDEEQLAAPSAVSTATPSDARPPAPVSPVVSRPLAAPAPLPEKVEAVRPDVRFDGVAPIAAAAIARSVEGVVDAVQVGTFEVSAATRDGLVPLSALAVDVDTFRRFTPDVTANAVGVWERLREGNAVFTAAVANRVDVPLGESITLSGNRTSESLRVGALAANGLPQLADLLLPAGTAHRLASSVQHTLLVAVAEGADVDAVAEQVAAQVGGEMTVLEEPSARQVQPDAVGHTTLESFTYQSVGDGTIRIDPDWVARNIVTAEVPLLGRVTCHRVVVPQLRAALEEIQAAGLGGEIYQYSGCWVPRHILWDPGRGISNHAWGLAFDINVPTNGYGATPQLDERIVDVFRRWGFRWGGDFSTPDGMHFELERIITS